MEAKTLPLLADVRDESAEDIRIVIEPRAATVDAALLMESLFRLTDLETRVPLNMNVLSRGVVPKVMGLGEVLNEWLAHRREVLHPALAAPARRRSATGSRCSTATSSPTSTSTR